MKIEFSPWLLDIYDALFLPGVFMCGALFRHWWPQVRKSIARYFEYEYMDEETSDKIKALIGKR